MNIGPNSLVYFRIFILSSTRSLHRSVPIVFIAEIGFIFCITLKSMSTLRSCVAMVLYSSGEFYCRTSVHRKSLIGFLSLLIFGCRWSGPVISFSVFVSLSLCIVLMLFYIGPRKWWRSAYISIARAISVDLRMIWALTISRAYLEWD